MTLAEPTSALRVHASPEALEEPRRGVGGNYPPRSFAHVCAECGEPYEGLKPFGGFCCPGHRAQFNNRRKTRGAELYDLVMAWRYQRGLAKTLALWKLVCRMAGAFRDEDWRTRAGRRSWRSPREVLAERPWLHANVVVRRRKVP